MFLPFGNRLLRVLPDGNERRPRHTERHCYSARHVHLPSDHQTLSETELPETLQELKELYRQFEIEDQEGR